jgi:hypothetical protein
MREFLVLALQLLGEGCSRGRGDIVCNHDSETLKALPKGRRLAQLLRTSAGRVISLVSLSQEVIVGLSSVVTVSGTRKVDPVANAFRRLQCVYRDVPPRAANARENPGILVSAIKQEPFLAQSYAGFTSCGRGVPPAFEHPLYFLLGCNP